MGFFSKIKNIWTSSEAEQAQITQAEQQNNQWREQLTLSLRQAEPRLSEWLNVITSDVKSAGSLLNERLLFLFSALEIPAQEANAFVTELQHWLETMGYHDLVEFKSELQYRLALALDMEDEDDERDRLFLKLSQGVSKTREQITQRIDSLIGSSGELDDTFWEEIEEIFIMADMGYEASMELVRRLRSKAQTIGISEKSEFKNILGMELGEIFATKKRIKAFTPPEVLMMIGVNGVGKTTTVAKLAYRAKMQGKKVLIAAGDTFRAAAIEQLDIWGKRIGVDFFTKNEGADPAAVAFEALNKAKTEGYDLLLLDTAGRLHTKSNLMEELKKIRRVLSKQHEGAPHRCVLTIDATTGQNALSQTKLFHEAIGVDEIILSKLDGTAKGGIAVALTLDFDLPISFIGLGEGMEDLRPFNGQDFSKALLGLEN